jgi:hypothetical protein
MSVRILILAAGDGVRWNKYRGTEKHKVVIEGEVLLERIVKQFSKYSDDIVIVGNDESYRINGTTLYVPLKTINFKDMGKFWSSKDAWSKDRTILVFGDTYFTDEAVETIMKDSREFTFFLRMEGSKITDKPWGEIFSIAFNGSFSEKLKETILDIVTSDAPLTAGGWHLFNKLKPQYESDFFTEIDDWTDDFDYPIDLTHWENKRKTQSP